MLLLEVSEKLSYNCTFDIAREDTRKKTIFSFYRAQTDLFRAQFRVATSLL